VAIDRLVLHDIPTKKEKFKHVPSAEEVWVYLFGMKWVSCEPMAKRDNSELQQLY
jgi:hypothetical protein